MICIAGLIPAHAGKTRAATVSTIHERAHPRSRGENTRVPHIRRGISGSSPLTRGKLQEFLYRVFGLGSSPLTRGKREYAADREARGGLIPAHAGKTH